MKELVVNRAKRLTIRSRASILGAAVALGCCALGWADTARAEPPSGGAPAEADIEPLVQRGIELRRNGQDAEALTVFEQALAEAPESDRVKVHLAATHQALGQWLEAEQYLSDALSDNDDPYVRRHRATLEKAYDFVDQRLGSLDVVGGPAGAELLLSGQHLGQLPLPAPVRVPIGSYVLEVRRQGYYSISRPISISGRALLRESVELSQREASAPAFSVDTGAATSGVEDRGGSPRWLTWTLTGAGVGAAAASVVAFSIREKHADRWNSNACMETGATRGEVCPGELESGRSAERWGIGTAIFSGVLLGGALTSYVLERHETRSTSALSLDGCGIAGAGARCFGSF
jgi:tetratricopeptide repeat protein